MKTIAVINESSVVSDAQLAVMVAAVQIQVSRDFAPAWGVDALLRVVGRQQGQPAGQDVSRGTLPGEWQIIIADTSDEMGTLGRHDTTAEGLPLGKVFAKTAIDDGEVVSATLSHEVLEMLADPDISTVVEVQAGDRTFLYAREICDPCGDDRYNYQVNGLTKISEGAPPVADLLNSNTDQMGKLGIEIERGSGREGFLDGLPMAGVQVSDFIYPRWFHNYRIGNVGAPTVKAVYQPYYQIKSDDNGWRVSCLQCGASASGPKQNSVELFVAVMEGGKPFGHGKDCVAAAITPDQDEAKVRAAASLSAPSPLRFDQAGHMSMPFQVLPGCYISRREISQGAGGWQDWQQRAKKIDSLAMFAMTGEPQEVALPYAARARVGSRRERRRTKRELWQRSKADFTTEDTE